MLCIANVFLTVHCVVIGTFVHICRLTENLKELSTTKKELSATKEKLSTTEEELSKTKGELELTQQDLIGHAEVLKNDMKRYVYI